VWDVLGVALKKNQWKNIESEWGYEWGFESEWRYDW
jgi:hypothetical protein